MDFYFFIVFMFGLNYWFARCDGLARASGRHLVGEGMSLLGCTLLVTLYYMTYMGRGSLCRPSKRSPNRARRLSLSFGFTLESSGRVRVSIDQTSKGTTRKVKIKICLRRPCRRSKVVSNGPLCVNCASKGKRVSTAVSIPTGDSGLCITSLATNCPKIRRVSIRPSVAYGLATATFRVGATAAHVITAQDRAKLSIPISRGLDGLCRLCDPCASSRVKGSNVPLLGTSPLIAGRRLSTGFLGLVGD